MSIHLSTAILAHLFSYDMYVFAFVGIVQFIDADCFFFRTWGSTGKEVERSSFWIEGGFIFNDVDKFGFSLTCGCSDLNQCLVFGNGSSCLSSFASQLLR